MTMPLSNSLSTAAMAARMALHDGSQFGADELGVLETYLTQASAEAQRLERLELDVELERGLATALGVYDRPTVREVIRMVAGRLQRAAGGDGLPADQAAALAMVLMRLDRDLGAMASADRRPPPDAPAAALVDLAARMAAAFAPPATARSATVVRLPVRPMLRPVPPRDGGDAA